MKIAENVAAEYAKTHRLLPIVVVPDNDEIAESRGEAYAECAKRSPRVESQNACIYGVEALIRQLRYLNKPLGQDY